MDYYRDESVMDYFLFIDVNWKRNAGSIIDPRIVKLFSFAQSVSSRKKAPLKTTWSPGVS